jgi:hypothetical protein
MPLSPAARLEVARAFLAFASFAWSAHRNLAQRLIESAVRVLSGRHLDAELDSDAVAPGN